MGNVAIKVNHLGKVYQIGKRESYKTLRDSITSAASAPFRWLGRRGERNPAETQHWALKDVSFEVQQGEAVGIIGRNGAGKSTLLKVLSRIVTPTEGTVQLRGRVGSLLEVGTGFHPELSGRENIYLNGAILGMRRAEISRKFDEIVAFSEIDKFLDTPVKRYSSGMYTRLAFAVAAHLEPEIFIVDEVLAVGDATFQKKCLGKMGDVATKEGRTVLFVSHNMGAVAQLCSRAILLNTERIVAQGPTRDVMKHYLSNAAAGNTTAFQSTGQRDRDIFVSNARAENQAGEGTTHFSHDEPITIAVTCQINRPVPGAVLGFFVRDDRGRKVFTTPNIALAPPQRGRESADTQVRASTTIPGRFLVPGSYHFTFGVSVPHAQVLDWVEDGLAINIIDGGSEFSNYEGADYGCVFSSCEWALESCVAC